MRKKTAHHSNAFGFAIFVGSLIGLLILVACIGKIILLFTQSTFDTKHQFVLEVREKQQTRFISINPDDGSIRQLTLHGTLPENIESSWGIPVDTVVTSSQDISHVKTLSEKLLFHGNDIQTHLNVIDALTVFIFCHTADDSQSLYKESTLPLDSTTQDSLFSEIFLDKTIYQEGESVAIVNGTNRGGFGNVVGRLLRHVGANVVAVTTADTQSPNSFVGYVGKTSYTVTRLSHILHLPIVHLSRVMVSDITVVLGTDFKK